MTDKTGLATLESMSGAQWYNSWLVNKVEKYLQGEILEVGCGIGNFTSLLERYGMVTAVDIRKEYVDLTKKVVKKSTKVGLGDIEKGKYFFGQKKFEAIICFNVLEHIEDDTKALKNLEKLLKSGGVLILIVPSHKFLYGEIDKSISHFRRYDQKELDKRVTKLGMKILLSKKINALGALGWAFAGKVSKDTVVSPKKLALFNLIAPTTLYLEKFVKSPFGLSVLLVAKKK